MQVKSVERIMFVGHFFSWRRRDQVFSSTEPDEVDSSLRPNTKESSCPHFALLTFLTDFCFSFRFLFPALIVSKNKVSSQTRTLSRASSLDTVPRSLGQLLGESVGFEHLSLLRVPRSLIFALPQNEPQLLADALYRGVF